MIPVMYTLLEDVVVRIRRTTAAPAAVVQPVAGASDGEEPRPPS